MKRNGAVVTAEDNGRSPRGERGLKLVGDVMSNADTRRSPRGERGLKLT